MNNDKITINGLMDGISVVENDNTQNTPCIQSDILYNDKEPITITSTPEEAESFNPSLYESVEDYL